MSSPEARTDRRRQRVLVSLALVLVVALAGIQPASADAKRSVSLRASSTSTTSGEKIRLSGKVSKASKGTPVKVQIYRSGRWQTINTARTSSAAGRFTIAIESFRTARYRARVSPTKRFKASTSRPLKVFVRTAARPSRPVPSASPTAPRPTNHPPPESATLRVSQGPGSRGGVSDGYAWESTVSSDGRYIAYESSSSNLAGESADPGWSIFLWDRQTRINRRISGISNGIDIDDSSRKPFISADGRFVAYSSSLQQVRVGPDNYEYSVYLWDRATGRTDEVSTAPDGKAGNANSDVEALSADGRFVVFASYASNLVAGDDNRLKDLFVWDRLTDASTKIADNVEGGYRFGDAGGAAITADGRFIAFRSLSPEVVVNDTNDGADIFVWDRNSGRTIKVTTTSESGEAEPPGGPAGPSISADGRFISYSADNSDMVEGDTNGERDVFVWDRQDGSTVKVTTAADGGEANGPSGIRTGASMSSDGDFVTFSSIATNLEQDGAADSRIKVYIWERRTGRSTRVSRTPDGLSPDGSSDSAAMSGDGRYVSYTSDASDIAGDPDTRGWQNVFVWDRLSASR